MVTHKVKRTAFLVLLALIIITGLIFLWHGHKPAREKSLWRFSTGVAAKNTQIFTSSKPARKFVIWNGKPYLVTQGGLFAIVNDELSIAMSTVDGLPSNDIRDAFNVDGNLMLATDNGLAIVEPCGRISVVKHSESAAANRINSLAVFGRELLLATDCGLFIMRGTDIRTISDGGRFVAATHSPGGFIIADDSGALFFTDGNIIDSLHLRLRQAAMLQYTFGKIAIATGRGALLVSLDGNHIDTLETSQRFTTLVKSYGDTIIAGGFFGADIIVNGIRVRTIEVPRQWGAVRDFIIDGREILLCGDGGVISGSGMPFKANTPPDNRITAICKHHGMLYVGTFSSGMAIFNGTQWLDAAFALPSPFVNSLVSDGEYLWAGVDGGLVRIGANATVFTRHNGLNSNTITSLYFDGDRLWAGTNKGVSCRHSTGWRQFYVSDGLCGDHIYSIAAERGVAWIAAYGGVSRIGADGSRCFQRADGALLNDWATAVAICKDGVFVGTYGGGISQYTAGEWKHHAEGAIINPNAVCVIEGRPVFGTANHGILAWDDMRFISIQSESGLPCDEILSLFADGEYIWVGTTHGLAKMQKSVIE